MSISGAGGSISGVAGAGWPGWGMGGASGGGIDGWAGMGGSTGMAVSCAGGTPASGFGSEHRSPDPAPVGPIAFKRGNAAGHLGMARRMVTHQGSTPGPAD